MDELIELYLFKNRLCPLPSVGVLQVVVANAVALYGDEKIEAPAPSIKLLGSSMPADDLIKFIASKKNINSSEAAVLLTQYCDKLQHMDAYSETKLPNSGKFYVDADGNLVFKSMEMPKAFLPVIPAERVIHPATSHTMVVGDKETTTTEMAAYYSDVETRPTDKWWIWAVGLAVLAAVMLFFHYKDQPDPAATGNTRSIETSPEFKTYSIAE